MYILKDKNYFPYAIANFFSNNERWQRRAINSPQYKHLEEKIRQHRDELLKMIPEDKLTKAKELLNAIDEDSALLSGISISEAEIEGLRAGLDLGELLYSDKSFESLLNENVFIEGAEKEAC